MGDNKRWSSADIAALLWVVLHFFTSIHSYFESWYYTYTGWSWAFLGIWLLGQVVIDVWISSGKPGLLRFVKWYWGISAALAAGGLFVSTLSVSFWVGILLWTICAFLTPLYQLLAFAWLLFDKLLGIRGSTLYGVEWSAILLFCLSNFQKAGRQQYLLPFLQRLFPPPCGSEHNRQMYLHPHLINMDTLFFRRKLEAFTAVFYRLLIFTHIPVFLCKLHTDVSGGILFINLTQQSCITFKLLSSFRCRAALNV
uniref:hypothetical protein n=1 Tax=uncultured Oscillibacter sp. TaxID=876091 RepID=UPI00272A1C1B